MRRYRMRYDPKRARGLTSDALAAPVLFKGFFSYAYDDAKTDPRLNRSVAERNLASLRSSKFRVGSAKYVAPVLARPLDQQERSLTPEQRDILGRIRQRQHFEVVATDFLKLPRARRNAEIDKIAEHIAGMIEQLRDLLRPPMPAAAERLIDRDPSTHGVPAGAPHLTDRATTMQSTPCGATEQGVDTRNESAQDD